MFKVYVMFKFRSFYISVIHLSSPSDFRDKLWVHLGAGMGLRGNFQTEVLFQDQHNIQDQQR